MRGKRGARSLGAGVTEPRRGCRGQEGLVLPAPGAEEGVLTVTLALVFSSSADFSTARYSHLEKFIKDCVPQVSEEAGSFKILISLFLVPC